MFRARVGGPAHATFHDAENALPGDEPACAAVERQSLWRRDAWLIGMIIAVVAVLARVRRCRA
jgi:hypothetical protein